ncbi:rubrerythrin family protein [Methanobacterium alcaliphilum]|uniref:rubrerythrin family protein n=1 Tax=Methanobacterium alcaliphilum TaxID=392018 RepID=UPI00200A580D|nr:rubrerythrin family protein [Methanobacterium alcaliphilum]MCK9150890.1 rubrerythrin family protein [Methanobacterium alcaliphilum]
MSTMDNLKEAFAGESQANRKYLAFAKKADDEGFPQIAKLFRAAAEAETVHAHNHLNAMEAVKSTEQNLKTAIEGETAEFEEMYPGFIEEAKEEGHTQAAWSFDVANKVEQIHAILYQKALDNIGNNEEVDYYICNWCGNTVENEAPEKCPICGAPKEEFTKID